MAKLIEVSRAEVAAARLLVKMAERRGETVADATRALANAAPRSRARMPDGSPGTGSNSNTSITHDPPTSRLGGAADVGQYPIEPVRAVELQETSAHLNSNDVRYTSNIGPLFIVAYADEIYRFRNGTRMQFGRDDEICQIPVWEEIRERRLSDVAGELWCSDGQMWTRNLSTVHELVVAGPTGTQVLPPRLRGDPGNACSIPIPRGTVTAPSTGTWVLEISAVTTAQDMEPELYVEDVPERLRETAGALCAPLLAGRSVVATYTEIAAQMGFSERVARRRVEELCDHYEAKLTALPGGRLPGEPLAQAVARMLVANNKVAVVAKPLN